MFRGSGPLASDLVGDRPDLLLEAAGRPPQDQHMPAELEDEGEQRDRADGAEYDPYDEPGGNLERCYTGPR